MEDKLREDKLKKDKLVEDIMNEMSEVMNEMTTIRSDMTEIKEMLSFLCSLKIDYNFLIMDLYYILLTISNEYISQNNNELSILMN